MPYTLETDSAVLVDSQVPVDDEVGLVDELDGLLLNSLNYKVTRQEKEKFGVQDQDVMSLMTRPRYDFEVDGEVTLLASPFVAHPGKCVDRTVLTNLGPATALGMPARGYLRYGQPDVSGKPGDLLALKVSLRLVFQPLNKFHKIQPV